MLDHSGGNFQVECKGDSAVVQLAPTFVVLDGRNLASYCRRFKSFAALLDRQGWGMIVDRLEFGACDLELVCTLYLVPWDFKVSVPLQSSSSPR